jgi:hypothetical protein
MARIRTIKPEYWTDDTITECSLSARLLFIGIWNFADDAGNLDRSAKQIKARVFPVDNVDCEALIQELLTHELLIEYSVSGKKYLHIPGFADHQVINRPSKPVVPGYEESLRTHGVLTEHSVTTHSGREGKGREVSDGVGAKAPTAPKKPKRPKTPIPEDFTLTPQLTEYAKARLPDVDPVALFESFKGKATAKGWAYADWSQALQEFIRNCAPNSGHWASGQYPKANGSIKWM